MTQSRSFHDQIAATALQKAEAARARGSSDPDLERPRDVILAACAAIAERLEPEGFTFRKSGPGLKRVEGDLTFEIHFQSDRNNIAGRRAAVWIHCFVSSRKLAKWRRSHPMPWGGSDGPGSGHVIGSQIGNLVGEPRWMEWDFADASRRASEIDDAVSAIRRIVLPSFAMFEDPASAVDILARQSGIGWPLVEYALVVLGREAAESAGRSFLECNPAIRQHFEAALTRFGQEGLPRCSSDLGSNLAAVAIAANLNLAPY